MEILKSLIKKRKNTKISNMDRSYGRMDRFFFNDF